MTADKNTTENKCGVREKNLSISVYQRGMEHAFDLLNVPLEVRQKIWLSKPYRVRMMLEIKQLEKKGKTP